MLLDPIDTRPITLANHVIRFLSRFHPVAYAQLKPDLTIVQVSNNFAVILNDFLPPQTLEGHYLPDLVWEFIGQEEAIQQVLRGQLPMLILELVNRPGANEHLNYLNFYLTAIKNEQEMGDSLLLLIEDVTATARIEQQLLQQRNELRLTFDRLIQVNEKAELLSRQKSLFLAFAAHELRAPLTVIDGYGQLLLRELGNEASSTQRQTIESLNQQISHLHQLLNTLLDIDKLEQGKVELNLFPEVIGDLLRGVVESLQQVARRNDIQLLLDIRDQTLIVLADPLRLRQIFYNLIWNAFKYTGPGGEIIVRMKQQYQRAVVQVIDTGRGIPAEHLEHLFQLHYRVKESDEEQISGSGIGLYLVKTWVEAHQGQIQVESVHGQGSTFSVFLPLYGSP